MRGGDVMSDAIHSTRNFTITNDEATEKVTTTGFDQHGVAQTEDIKVQSTASLIAELLAEVERLKWMLYECTLDCLELSHASSVDIDMTSDEYMADLGRRWGEHQTK
jgi:hypothetical protein